MPSYDEIKSALSTLSSAVSEQGSNMELYNFINFLDDALLSDHPDRPQDEDDVGCLECQDMGNRHDPCGACGRGTDPAYDGYLGVDGEWRKMCCDTLAGDDHADTCDGLTANA